MVRKKKIHFFMRITVVFIAGRWEIKSWTLFSWVRCRSDGVLAFEEIIAVLITRVLYGSSARFEQLAVSGS